MASNIKGITIEIDGNTTGLSNALKDVNKVITSVNSELRQVNQLLKLDPKNAELLAQKQKLLSKAIEETNGKLVTLKLAKEEADKQLANGEIGEEQFRSLQREIVKSEQNLKSFKDQSKLLKAEMVKAPFDGVAEGINNIGTKATVAGKALTPVAAGIIAIGTASVVAFGEVDTGLDSIVSKTGAGGKELEGLEKIFEKVYGNFAATSQEVGDAVGGLNQRFGFVGKELEGATTTFLKFAKITGQDVNTAISLTARAMGDAGIESKDYEKVLDAVTKASQKTGIGTDVLLESLTKFGAPMRQLGFDMDESIALFSQWEKAGVNTDIAFSGLKKAISNALKDGKDPAEELTKALKGVQDGSMSTKEAMELFGAKAGPDLIDAIKGGRFSIEEMQETLENTGGTVKNTFKNMEDGIDGFDRGMNSVKLGASALGEQLGEQLGPVFEDLGKWLADIGEWFSGLNEDTKKWVINIGLLVIGLTAFLLVFGVIAPILATAVATIGSIVALIASWNLVTKLVTASQWLLNIAMMANPIGIMIIAIIALIGIFVLLWTKTDWFKKEFMRIWDNITKSFTKAINGIGKLVGDVLNWFSNLGNSMGEVGRNIIEGIFDGITKGYTWFKNKVKEWVGNVTKFIKKLFGIHSPSTVMRDQIGLNLGKGMALGIEDSIGMIKGSLEKVNAVMSNEMGDISVKNPGTNIVNLTVNAPSLNNGEIDKLTKQINKSLGNVL